MTETFLILLAAGLLLAAAIPDPKQVTLHWLRLTGIIALSLAALGLFFYLRRDHAPSASPSFHRRMLGQIITLVILLLAHLAFVQTAYLRTQRAIAAVAFLLGTSAATGLLHELMIPRGTANPFNHKLFSMILQFLTSVGVASMVGLAIMDMLLGHAYLTASRMTIAPFLRLNTALIITIIARSAVSVGLVLGIWYARPDPMLWNIHGLLVGTRWLVGLIIPAVFAWMAHDCIRRRSTQSATGILYVAGTLIFIGEIIALHLIRETGLPF